MVGCVNDSSNHLAESRYPDACSGVGYAGLAVLKSVGLITVAIVTAGLVLGIMTINVAAITGACMYSPISLLGVIPVVLFDIPIMLAIGKGGIEITLGLGGLIYSDSMRARHSFASVEISENAEPKPWV